MAGSVGNGRDQGRALVPPRDRSPTHRDPGRVNVLTLSRRTNARNPVSHAGDGHVGRVLGGARCARTTSLPTTSANLFPARLKPATLTLRCDVVHPVIQCHGQKCLTFTAPFRVAIRVAADDIVTNTIAQRTPPRYSIKPIRPKPSASSLRCAVVLRDGHGRVCGRPYSG